MLSVLALLVSVAAVVHATPNGAPTAACNTMVPDHPGSPTPGGNDRYTIDLSDNGDGSYTVTLSANSGVPDFRGFFLQARSDATGNTPLGSWSVIDSSVSQVRICSPSNGLTHTDREPKDSISGTWTPGSEGGVFIQASVVEEYETYFTEIRANV